MLKVVQSNRTEALAAQLADTLFEVADDGPLLPPTEVILTQNQGMAQWLKQDIARRCGVATNLDFQLPPVFIWHLLRTLVDDKLPAVTPWQRSVMGWHLFALLGEEGRRDPLPPELVRYLQAGATDTRRRLQLAEQIARVFDGYLVYRPDWVLGWLQGEQGLGSGTESGPVRGSEWQAGLWQALAKRIGQQAGALHRAEMTRELSERLARLDKWPTELPRRISVFGASWLASAWLDLLQAVSAHCEVCVYLLNPCRHFWGDVVPEAKRAKRALREHLSEEDDIALGMVGNPLLAALGQQGREFVDALLDYDADFDDVFAEPEADDALGFLQREIFDLEFRGRFDVPFGTDPDEPLSGRHVLAADDESVRCHVCHSPMREVEVLHDAILHYLKQGQETGGTEKVKAENIIVMLPDVDSYAAAIHAVFAGEHPVPYNLVEQTPEQASALLAHFLGLLELPERRCSVSELADILELPALQRRLGLGPAALARLRRWAHESGTRWALSASHRASFGLEEDEHFSWRFGLNRLWLGYAMASDEASGRQALHGGVLAVEDMDTDAADLLVRLDDFVGELETLRRHLLEERSIGGWMDLLMQLAERLYAADSLDDDEEVAINLLRTALDEMHDEVRRAGVDEAVSAACMIHRLRDLLHDQQGKQRFLSRGVTFCGMQPMRSIPFDMVCILGLGGEFPRQGAVSGLDLLQQTPRRRGDRSRRLEDQYMFLEAVLAARSRLHLSCTGRSVRDNSDLAQSPVLREFVETAVRSMATAAVAGKGESGDGAVTVEEIEAAVRRQLVIEHPLQPFDRFYFQADAPLRSFSWRHFKALRALEKPPKVEPFVDGPIVGGAASDDDIELDDLGRFLGDPAVWFFKQVLQLDPELNLQAGDDEEPFALAGLDDYKVTARIIELVVDNIRADRADDEDIEERLLASGALLRGEAGRRQLQERRQAAAELGEQLRGYVLGAVRQQPLRLEGVAGRTVAGSVGPLYVDREHEAGERHVLLHYRPRMHRSNQLVAHWVRHVAACAAGMEVTTLLLGTEASAELVPVEQQQAGEYLQDMVAAWNEGQVRPLPFDPRSAWEPILKGEPDRFSWPPEVEGQRRGAGQARTVPDRRQAALKRLLLQPDEQWLDREAALDWADRLLRPLVGHYRHRSS